MAHIADLFDSVGSKYTLNELQRYAHYSLHYESQSRIACSPWTRVSSSPSRISNLLAVFRSAGESDIAVVLMHKADALSACLDLLFHSFDVATGNHSNFTV